MTIWIIHGEYSGLLLVHAVSLYLHLFIFKFLPWFILMSQETQKWSGVFGVMQHQFYQWVEGVLGVLKWVCRIRWAQPTIQLFTVRTSTHPCCTVFALALSGGELSPHAAVVTALGVSLSVWQLVQFLPRIDKGWLSLILFFNTMFVCPLGINGKTTKSFCIFYFLLLQVVYLWFRIIEVSKKKST